MASQYNVKVLNADHDVETFKLTNLLSGDTVKILDFQTESDEKKFTVQLDIEFDHNYFDLECEKEVEDPYSVRDYDDGSYGLINDIVTFDVECNASVRVEAYLTFNSDGSAAVDLSNGSLSLDHLSYTTNVTASDLDEWDNYNDDELIDFAEVADKILKDEEVGGFITELVNELQFELEELEA